MNDRNNINLVGLKVQTFHFVDSNEMERKKQSLVKEYLAIISERDSILNEVQILIDQINDVEYIPNNILINNVPLHSIVYDMCTDEIVCRSEQLVVRCIDYKDELEAFVLEENQMKRRNLITLQKQDDVEYYNTYGKTGMVPEDSGVYEERNILKRFINFLKRIFIR